MVVERVLGQAYGPPLTSMRSCLDQMDATLGGELIADESLPRLLAALGPKMMQLAAPIWRQLPTPRGPGACWGWALRWPRRSKWW